jgi:hypothetical protein
MASMKSFQALRSPAIALTSFHDLPVFLNHLPFPFHAKGAAFYIRPFTLHFSFFNNSIFKVCKLLAYSSDGAAI